MFEWNGKEIATIGDLLDGAINAMNEGRSGEYLRRYRAFNEYADTNLGYVFGYCDEDTRKRLFAAYPVSHPVFGSNF